MIEGKCTTRPLPTSECKVGFTKTPSGACLPNSVVQRCPQGEVKQKDGTCKALLTKPRPKVEQKPVPKKLDTPTKKQVEKVPVPRKRSLPSKPVIKKEGAPKQSTQPVKKRIEPKKQPN